MRLPCQPRLLAGGRSRATRSEGLAPSGARAAFVGCGTSLFMAQAAAGLRERSGAGETDAFAASQAPLDRPYDTVVAISRSGTTTEVVRFLREVRAPRRVAMVGVADSPVAERPTRSWRSRSPTSARSCRLASRRASSPSCGRGSARTSSSVAGRAETILNEPLPIDPTEHDHFVSLGEGWSVGLANEGALKLRRPRSLDRVVPGDGVPARTDQRRPRGKRGLGARPGGSCGPRRVGGVKRRSSAASSDPWWSSSGSSGRRPRSPRPAAWIPIVHGT